MCYSQRVPELVVMPTTYYQLCLNLGDTLISYGSRVVRPIPEVVKELFELSDTSPSGIVWRDASPNGRRKAGKPAGSPAGKNLKYFIVFVRGHGYFYAHRIIYLLKYGENPGSMVVRHVGDDSLILGFLEENLKDEKGKCKKSEKGYTTSKMYSYDGELYNLSSLCKVLNVSYSMLYQRLRASSDPAQVFRALGIEGVIHLF